MQRHEFALARTALTCGLQGLAVPPGDAILLPDFLCDSVWPAVRKCGLRVIPYQVTDALTPDWDALMASVRRNHARALLSVHYFGQPQDLERHRSFCDDNGLWLVEDNAHGYGGTWRGRLLGTFGDIGIASPRKILGTASGGVLYGNAEWAPEVGPDFMPPFPANSPLRRAKMALSRAPRVKKRIRGLLDLSKNWSDPRLYREAESRDYAIDALSHRLIHAADWGAIARQRRSAWVKWSAFARHRGLEPVFPEVHPESCPWAFPAYARDLEERNQWLRWGARHGVTLFPWPSLPDEMIAESGQALGRWKRLICFSLDHAPA